jgi:hypothetical protein
LRGGRRPSEQPRNTAGSICRHGTAGRVFIDRVASTERRPLSQATPQVKAAAEKFIKVGLLIGYPDKSADQYYDRLRPLMTKSGFAQQKKDLGNLDSKAAKQAYTQQIRVNTKTVSPVRVTAVTETKASAQGTYRLLRQQQIGGKWKTLKTDDEKSTIKLTLVNDNGTWLVDTAK